MRVGTDSGTELRELSQSGMGRNYGIERNQAESELIPGRNQFRNVQHCGIGCILTETHTYFVETLLVNQILPLDEKKTIQKHYKSRTKQNNVVYLS